MLRFRRFNFIFIVMSALFLFETAVFAQGQASVIYLKGAPKIVKAGKTEWEECKVSMAIATGDHIKTLKEEAVEISFLKDKSNIIRVEGDSDVFVRRNEAPYSLELIDGSLIALIKKLPKNSTFEIATPVGTCGARGTGWRSSTNKTTSRFEAFEHRIYVKGIDQSGKPMDGELIVNNGWASTLNKYEKPEKLDKLSYNDIERWNKWRRDLSDRLKNMERAMDKAGKTESRIEELDSMKSDIRESRDTDRVESQQDRGSSGGGSRDNYSPPTTGGK